MINFKLIEGISSKNNQPYIALQIEFPNGYKKLVFPANSAEKFIFQQINNK